MEKSLINKLIQDYPDLKFNSGSSFYWSPKDKKIFFNPKVKSAAADWSLLHETSHALLKHKNYRNDFELLNIEIEAWEKAKDLGRSYNITIDESHIQDCLNSYRDWLYRRSVCPTCGTISVQHDEGNTYQCHNCHCAWQVSASRFCRPYRQVKTNKKSPAAALATGDSLLI